MLVHVKTPCRLHFALIDLNGGMGRVDGSFGLALNYPNTIIEATRNRTVKVVGKQADVVEGLVTKFLSQVKAQASVKVSVKKLIPSHVGLGSGTQLSLAIAAAVSRTLKIRRNSRKLAEIMGRGGTSGIGVAAFERGGLILDGGHAFGEVQVKKSFLPSSASNAPPSPVIGRYDFPQNWRFVVAIPNVQRGLHGEDETRTFSDRCPITSEEVGKVCRLILVKALPSLLEGDIIGFGSALDDLQEAGFAGATKDLVHPLVRSCVEFMRSKGAYGAGQSSFGPATFGLVKGNAEADKLEAEVRGFFSANAGGTVFQSAANCHGAIVKIIKG